jgi:hypothetical protein
MRCKRRRIAEKPVKRLRQNVGRLVQLLKKLVEQRD